MRNAPLHLNQTAVIIWVPVKSKEKGKPSGIQLLTAQMVFWENCLRFFS